MVSNWLDKPLGEIVSLQRGHDLPAQDRVEGPVPIMGSSGLTGFHDTARAPGPGVVVGRSGNSMGVVSYSKGDYWPLNTCLYVTDFKGNDERYIHYLLQQIDFDQFNSGSAQKSLNRNAVYPHKVHMTDDKLEQRLIGRLLEAYNNKIELNRQMNTTLESIAQALFKSWFVDFDPVIDNALEAGIPIPEPLQARAEGRKALGEKRKALPEHIQSQLPNSFVFTDEMGWIPEGWLPKPLDEIANYQNGLALQKFRPESEDEFLPVVKIAQLRKGFADGDEKASRNIRPECIIDDGDVVFSWSGSLMVDIWCGGPAALNQHLFKVTSDDYPKWFFHQHTCHHLDEFQRIASDKAVTMGHIKREHLSRAFCAVPHMETLAKCSHFFEHWLERAVDCRLESRQLQLIRDALLPRLLSGKLRIPDVEKHLAEAI